MKTTQSVEVLTGDLIDIRQIIERYEELELVFAEGRELTDEEKVHLSSIAGIEDTLEGVDEERREQADELLRIIAALDECRGNGGDEQWRGDWFPVTLIHESYFETYARELAEDCGMVAKDASWPNQFIDWEAASEALLQDYTSVDIDGSTYYTR